ncbi:hypothetical protein [uncultured Bradyrhizobium sp.]|uniref:hypothetical protein n=1 Tax=uncultured Bradyrhizobium sp. TaxID=199684 RepID=UPI0035CB543E
MTKLHDWEAVADMMPPKPFSLRVTGKVKGNEGQTVELAPAVPQGINPEILILELTIQGRGAKPADLDGAYEDPKYDGQYKQVTIRYEAETVTVDIKIVA